MADNPSGFGDLFDALDAAFEADDHKRARQIAIRMNEADQPPSVLMDEFTAAVADEEYEKAQSIVEKLGQTYDEQEGVENQSLQRSIVARTQANVSDDERADLHGHVQQAISVELTRGAFLVDAAAFLEYPEVGDEEALKETADLLGQREVEYDQAREEAVSVTDGMDLPPAIRFLSITTDTEPFERGALGVVSVVVGNVGTETASGVQLETTSTDGIQVDSATVSIGEIEPDSTSTTDLDVTAEERGTHSLTFNLTSENAGAATETSSIDVLDESAVGSQDGGLDGVSLLDVDVPDWLPVAAGAGTIGAGGYAYIKYLSARDDNHDKGV